MPKPVDDSLSDGLEIMSIGTLYVGRWDRKYWSSSRGKDRYPYPIGYQAVQIRNGLTYMMEVLEGAKGPIFQITSNDKQSTSGETPDIAWGNFMKKGCSRLKHWPEKRFSGKVDGVELFGFKNALVQRLLRQLVAFVSHASDHSSHSNNMGKASAKGQDGGHPVKYQSPDLISSSDQTKVTSKRKRTRNDIDTTSGCKRSEKIFQLLNEDDIGKDPCITRTINNDEPVTSTSSVCKINQADEPLLLLPDMELGKNVPLPDKDLPVKSIVLDDLKAESSLADVQSKLASTKKSFAASFADVELLLENNLPDRQCTRTLGQGLYVVTKEENGKAQATPDDELNSMSPVLTGILINRSAPDSLDTQQGSGNCIQQNATSRTEIVADIVISEEPISGSQSDDQTYVTGCFGKSGFDTVGEDIANPMQSALLPRAIPFLKHSLKRKKKKASSSKQLSCGLKYDEKLVASTHDKSDAEGVKRTNPFDVHANPVESIIENSKYIVPDSLDDDQSEYFVGNKLPSPFKNAEKVSVDAQENKMFNHKVLPKDCDMRVLKDGVLASHSYQTFIPPNHIVEGVDHWSTAEANFNFILHSSKKTYEENISDGMFSQDSAGVQKYPLHVNIPPKKEEYSSPLSESIICMNGDSHVLEMDHEAETLVSSDSSQSRGIVDSYLSKTSFGVQGKLERQFSYLKGQEAFGQNNTLSIVQAQENALNCALMIDSGINRADIRVRNSQQYHRKNKIGAQHGESAYQSSDPRDGGCQNCTFGIEEYIANTGISCPAKQRSYDIEENMKLIGCYSHLLQISSVKLADIGDEIYICVSCGPPEDGKRDLFLYKLSSKEPSLGRPCVVGHTSIRLPSLKDEFGRDVAMDKSALQFTPDARGLVLVDSIRLPYCRENNLHCSCPQCESCCFEENAVKIVQIQHGYASLILKLRTIYAVHCILVCEPQCLIAVDESGRIYIWIMDPTWSIQMEQHIILSYDFLSSRIIELKRVPKSFSMVIGHNGYGQFSLWDIAKRTVVAEFSGPANSILEYLPVSLFWCQTKSMSGGKFVMEECAKKLVEETTLWFSGQNGVNMSCLTGEKDVALWVLMYTSSDSTFTSVSSSYSSNSDGCWRLCLLVKNTVIMGSAFPSSTASIGTSSGIGIIGTCKGCVDIWELATGNQLGSLHHHAGKRVSHVAVDDSSSSIVAVAHDDGQLFVYLRH